MKNFIKGFIQNVVNSLNIQQGGFSARKLTAFVTMALVIYLHIRYVDLTNVITVLIYDMVFILVLFGIVTIDQLYKFKTGNGTNNNPTEASQPKPDDKNEIK